MLSEKGFRLAVFFLFSAAFGFFFSASPEYADKIVSCNTPGGKFAAAVTTETPSAATVRVPIAVYHSVRPYIPGESEYQDRYDVTPELFRKHLEYLKDNNYSPISFATLANYFDNGTPLPGRPVILSFDDSWENQYEYAFPLLEEFHMTGTFFVFTNSLGRGVHLTWDEVKEMRDAGMEIGSHTKTHPYLNESLSPEELKKEIAGSKAILESELGIRIDSFAYPFGEHSTTTAEAVKDAGYRTGRTLKKGVDQTKKERFELNAFLTTDDFEDFVRKIEK